MVIAVSLPAGFANLLAPVLPENVLNGGWWHTLDQAVAFSVIDPQAACILVDIDNPTSGSRALASNASVQLPVA